MTFKCKPASGFCDFLKDRVPPPLRRPLTSPQKPPQRRPPREAVLLDSAGVKLPPGWLERLLQCLNSPSDLRTEIIHSWHAFTRADRGIWCIIFDAALKVVLTIRKWKHRLLAPVGKEKVSFSYLPHVFLIVRNVGKGLHDINSLLVKF